MAKRILADPTKFGDHSQAARKILSEYEEVPCSWCAGGGIVQQSSVGRFECQVCEGTGVVWKRR